MSSITLVTSSDEHLSDQNPGFRKDDYRGSILKKLDWQGDLVNRVNADLLVRGGDLFHIKAANKTTHGTMQRLMEIHRSYKCPTYSLSGNHDMTNNDPDSIMKGQPLGVLFKSGVVHKLDETVIEKGSLKCRVIGIDYTPDMDIEYIREKVTKKSNDLFVVAVIHALASYAPSEKIQSFFNEKIIDYRDLIFNGCPDAYVFGHYHKDQGIQEHEGVQFVNLGAVSRGSLTFENLDRKPKVSTITMNSSGLSIEEHIIPHEDSSEIFDLDLKKRLDMERKDLDDFIKHLRHTEENSIDDRRSELENFPSDLKSLALEVLEAAESGVLDE